MNAIPPGDPLGARFRHESEEKQSLRLRLLKAQRLASARIVDSRSDNARGLLLIVMPLAGLWAYADATADQLAEMLSVVMRVWVAAGSIERLEGGE